MGSICIILKNIHLSSIFCISFTNLKVILKLPPRNFFLSFLFHMIQHISHDTNELSLDSSVGKVNGKSQLEFSMYVKEGKNLPNIS